MDRGRREGVSCPLPGPCHSGSGGALEGTPRPVPPHIPYVKPAASSDPDTLASPRSFGVCNPPPTCCQGSGPVGVSVLPPYCCNHICRCKFDHPQDLYFHPFHLNFSRRWNYVRLWVPNFISTWFVQPQLHSMHPWIINHRSIFLPFFYRISVGGGEKKSP